MGESMTTISELTEKIRAFVKERDWEQFHNPKDMAVSLVLEAGEVLEHFQWRNNIEVEEYLKTNKKAVGEELADVLYWVLLMCNNLEIDIKEELEKKMKKNEKKYPIEKAKGNHRKYTEL